MKHLAIPLVLAAALSSGCMHTTSKLPGVLDLRSDGSGAAPENDAVKTTPEVTRDGLGGWLTGEGLKVTGDKVVIEDRQWHIIGLFPAFNDMGAAEYAALPKGTTMRSVKVGDGLVGTDVILAIAPSLVSWIPIVNLVGLINLAPRMTLNVSGTRVQGGAGAALETAPPTSDVPPADATPTPPSGT